MKRLNFTIAHGLMTATVVVVGLVAVALMTTSSSRNNIPTNPQDAFAARCILADGQVTRIGGNIVCARVEILFRYDKNGEQEGTR